MTRRARDRAFASAFQVNVVFVGEGKNVVPFVSFDGFYQLPSRVLEMNFNPVGMVGFWVKRLQVFEAKGSGEGPTLFQASAGSQIRVEPLSRT